MKNLHRAYYDLGTYWIKDFNYEDYIDLKFHGPVVVLKWAHPVAKVVDIGKDIHRVLFRNVFRTRNSRTGRRLDSLVG